MDINEYNKYREIRCNKRNKHKYRTNKFGVTWCVICGLLGKCSTKSLPLDKEDKIMIRL